MFLGRRDFLGMMAAGSAAQALAAQAKQQATKPAVPQAAQTKPREATLRITHAAAAARRGDPWLEISTASLAWNLLQIQSRVPDKIVMAVIKANAYGHGLVGVGRALEQAGAEHFLVGKLDEARELRAAGIRGRIMNFGPYSEADAEDILRLDISQNVYTDQVEALDRAARRRGHRAHVHIKVDTGLGRFGVPHDRALEFIERVAALRGVAIEGVFTTLVEDPEFDAVQLARLKEICARATSKGLRIGARHAASSDAICDFPAAVNELDMVRPGIMLYGLYPSTRAEHERKLDLQPALSLKTRVAYVKTLRAGESMSYHRAFTATEPERVATLPAGYSDGVPRALAPTGSGQAGKGSVLIAGRRCPIVAITSNAVMARLGDTPAEPGDEAVLIGAQGGESITASEVAQLSGRNVYNVVIELSGLLPTVFL